MEWRESASPNTSGESSETKLALTDAGAGAAAEEAVEAEAGAGASSSSFLYLALSVLEFCVWLLPYSSLTIYIYFHVLFLLSCEQVRGRPQ